MITKIAWTGPIPPQGDWLKCPSITPGGKPWFWTRVNSNGAREWVVWDRLRERFNLEIEENKGGAR